VCYPSAITPTTSRFTCDLTVNGDTTSAYDTPGNPSTAYDMDGWNEATFQGIIHSGDGDDHVQGSRSTNSYYHDDLHGDGEADLICGLDGKVENPSSCESGLDPDDLCAP